MNINFSKLEALVLAGGKSSRFKTRKNKLLFKIAGKELFLYPIELLNKLSIDISIISNPDIEDDIKNILNLKSIKFKYINQNEPRGTGDALIKSFNMFSKENILVINGDMPIIDNSLIYNFYNLHLNNNSDVSIVSSILNANEAKGYGIIFSDKNRVSIIEWNDYINNNDKDIENSKQILEINCGIYIFKKSFLDYYLKYLKYNSNGEIYLTDLIKLASDNNLNVSVYQEKDFLKVKGINTLVELSDSEKYIRSIIIKKWMNNGVYFHNPDNTIIDYDVVISSDVYVSSSASILGDSFIDSNSFIGQNSFINNSKIYSSFIEPYSYIENSIINRNAKIGPFAVIKNGSQIFNNAVIGNFVELNRSLVDQNSKIKHLAYIGDTKIGKKCNIGAGTVICNYDGFRKNKTNIEDGVFIGANSSLIAPLNIGENSLIAAGSVITESIDKDSFSISRVKQVNKKNYASILKDKIKNK